MWDAPKRPPWRTLRHSAGRWGHLDHFMHMLGIKGRLMKAVCDRYDKELGA